MDLGYGFLEYGISDGQAMFGISFLGIAILGAIFVTMNVYFLSKNWNGFALFIK